MYANILPVLCCPKCGAGFKLTESRTEQEEIVEGKIVCENGHAFSIHEGILDFQSQEKNTFNTWKDYIDEDGYDAFGEKLETQKTDSQRKIEKDFLDGIVEEVSKLKAGFLLDVASGRGVLLRELLKHANENVDIISTDLSFHVLKHDRIRLGQVNPHVRVNYIACDATNLPLRDCSMDMACTYAGLTNMADLMEKGIRDAARVLKDDAPLINSSVYMDENAEGAKRAAKFLAENHMEGAEKIFIRNELLAIHKAYFSTVREKIIYEGIAEAVEGDLIPCDGEWFANVILIAR